MNRNKKNEWFEWLQAIIIALLIALSIKCFLFDIIEVEGNSMNPTLEDKDRLIVNKINYYFNQPEVGDIVIFEYPADRNFDFIKRIVAKEGDIVEIKNSTLYVNENKIIEPYIEAQRVEPFPRTVVPKDHFFVLGDNRRNSRDSRFSDVGFLKLGDIKGVAIYRIWPFRSLGSIK